MTDLKMADDRNRAIGAAVSQIRQVRVEDGLPRALRRRRTKKKEEREPAFLWGATKKDEAR
jgi:hypothetical protein